MTTIAAESPVRRSIKKILNTAVPDHLRERYVPVTDAGLSELSKALKESYLNTDFIDDDGGKNLHGLLEGRLALDRQEAIPWLDSVRSLQGARVLEIGCGTGASTVALAEQGADVIGVDVSEKALRIARLRCQVYEQNADFRLLNASALLEHFAGERFDFVIFWACLEHMTTEERLSSMRESWELLDSGSYWCVVDTPNRLYFHDGHTSLLPFYNWLPDDVAIRYAGFSPRGQLRDEFPEYAADEAERIRFARWGRGVSYHEFELAIAPLQALDIVSCLPIYMRERSLYTRWRARRSDAHRYEKLLQQLVPGIHPAFLQPGLDFVLRKP